MATFFESIRIKAINVEKIALLLSALLLASCLGRPDGVSPVEQLDTQRYLGTWYEVARLDHSFERGLSNVTADYSMREEVSSTALLRRNLTETRCEVPSTPTFQRPELKQRAMLTRRAATATRLPALLRPPW